MSGLWRVALAATLSLLPVAATARQPVIDAGRIKEHVRILAGAELEGRGSGQPAEPRTLDYLTKAFHAAGLLPAGEHGGWLQEVRLAEFTRTAASMTVGVGDATMKLVPGRDVTASSRLAGRTSITDAPMVFVGYAIDAPELGWDTLAGVDLRGKIAVFLANDPDFDQPNGPFGGTALSYFGRVSAKIETAQRHGAVAALIVHDMPASRIPWTAYAAADGSPATDLADPPKPFGLRGWIPRERAVALFAAAGLDFDALATSARSAGFRAVPIGDATLSAEVETTARRFVTHNVIGKIPGVTRPDEAVLYGAHWDAFGIGAPDARADRIHSGAIDNASGVGTMIEVARAFAHGRRPSRTILFAAWAAEEKDLLGSQFYTVNPLHPLDHIVAAINLDPHRPPAAARDLEIIGAGRTSLEDDLARVATRLGLRISPETAPDAGWYFRSDHFPFARAGVPALYFRMGQDLVRGGPPAGRAAAAAYAATRYHKPGDKFDPDWDMTGSAQEGELAYWLGRDLAFGNRTPCWKRESRPESVAKQQEAIC